MTANIAAQPAKELVTPFSLTATVVTRIALEISRAATKQIEKGRTTRPFSCFGRWILNQPAAETAPRASARFLRLHV
jgi:hypothetical protein